MVTIEMIAIGFFFTLMLAFLTDSAMRSEREKREETEKRLEKTIQEICSHKQVTQKETTGFLTEYECTVCKKRFNYSKKYPKITNLPDGVEIVEIVARTKIKKWENKKEMKKWQTQHLQ